MKTRSSLTSTRRQIPQRSVKKDPSTSQKPSTSARSVPVQQRRSMPAIKVATPTRKVAVTAKTVTTPAPSVKKLPVPPKKSIPPAKVIKTENVTQKDFLSGFNLIPPQQAIQIVQDQKRKRPFKVAQIQRNASQRRNLLPPTRDVILNDRRKRPYSDISQAPNGNGTSSTSSLSYPGNSGDTQPNRFPPALLKQFQRARAMLTAGQHPSNKTPELSGQQPFNRRSLPSIFNRAIGDPRRFNQGQRQGVPIAGPSGLSNGKNKKPLLDGEVIVLDDSDDDSRAGKTKKTNGHARRSLAESITQKPANGLGARPLVSIQPQANRKSVNIPIIYNDRRNRIREPVAGSSKTNTAFRNGRIPHYVTSSREVELIPLGPDLRRSSSSSPSNIEEAEPVCEVLPLVHEPSIPEEQNPFPREVRPALLAGRLENIRERGWIQRALLEEEQRDRIRDQMMLNCFDMHFSYAKMFMDLANRQLERCREELINRQPARSSDKP